MRLLYIPLTDFIQNITEIEYMQCNWIGNQLVVKTKVRKQTLNYWISLNCTFSTVKIIDHVLSRMAFSGK